MNPKFINTKAIKAELKRLTAEQDDLTRRKSTLRVQIWRLKKLLKTAEEA